MITISHRCFADPDDLQSGIRDLNVEYKVMERGDFHAGLLAIDTGSVLLQYGRVSLARIMRIAMLPGKFALTGWIGSGPLPIVRGIQMLPGEMKVSAPGGETVQRNAPGNDTLSVTMSPDHLNCAARALIGRPLDVGSGRIVRPAPGAAARFLSLANRASKMIEMAGSVPPGTEATRAFSEAATRAVLGCLVGGEVRSRPVSTGDHVKIMAKFMDAVEANLDQPLYVTDLCVLVGVSARLLRQCCQEALGMSPHRFLVLRRLQLARRALMRVGPRGTSVTAVATEFGFWELGRFAVMYRRAFGESPSGTLRRFRASSGYSDSRDPGLGDRTSRSRRYVNEGVRARARRTVHRPRLRRSI